MIRAWYDKQDRTRPKRRICAGVMMLEDRALLATGAFEFAQSAFTVSENAGTATITVNRVGGTEGEAKVDYATVATGSSATAGTDYTPTNGTLTFGDGVTTQTFTVTVLDDTQVEGTETVNLALSNPTDGTTLGTQATAGLNINDFEAGSLQFSTTNFTVNEDAGSVTVTVTRVNGTDGTATVSYSTADSTAFAGTDYTATNGTLTFQPGVASQSFTVPIINNPAIQTNKRFIVNLSDPTGGANLGAPSSSFVTINDVSPGELQFGLADFTVAENKGTATITVTRTNGTSNTVMVRYATTPGGTAIPGTDYTDVSGILTFGPGVSTQTFSVPILDDKLNDSSKTVRMALSDPTNGAVLGTQSTATLTITDFEEGQLAFDQPTYFVEENVGNATITVTRTGGSQGSVSVQYATSNGSAISGVDYTTASGTLVFANGETTKTFSVPITNRSGSSGDRFLNLTLTNAGGGATLGSQATATLTISDFEAGTLSFSSPSYAVNEAGGSVTVTVNRTPNSLGTVTVNYATSDGTGRAGINYLPVSGTLTFATGETTKTFTVPVINVPTTDPNTTFNVTLTGPTGGSQLTPPSSATITILDSGTNPLPVASLFRVVLRDRAINRVVLSFNTALDVDSAEDVFNYVVTASGNDRRFGNRNDRNIEVVSALYDSGSRTVNLELAQDVGSADVLRVMAIGDTEGGITDTTGAPLDGNNDGTSGGIFIGLVSIGSRIRYLDAGKDAVALNLGGGGWLEVDRGRRGDAHQLRLTGTVRNRSVLAGGVHRTAQGGNGRTSLPRVIGANGTKILLKNPPFIIGGAAANAANAKTKGASFRRG